MWLLIGMYSWSSVEKPMCVHVSVFRINLELSCYEPLWNFSKRQLLLLKKKSERFQPRFYFWHCCPYQLTQTAYFICKFFFDIGKCSTHKRSKKQCEADNSHVGEIFSRGDCCQIKMRPLHPHHFAEAQVSFFSYSLTSSM